MHSAACRCRAGHPMGCGASAQNPEPARQLVLLGGGECGKTTIFKQIQLLHGSGFSDEVRSDWISAVCSSPLRSMTSCCSSSSPFPFPCLKFDQLLRQESCLNFDQFLPQL